MDAFADRRLAPLRLLLAGDGMERTRLEERARRLGIADQVHFLGSVNRDVVGRLLRGASVFAFPSRGEAFGIALLEAMAAGVPSVAAAAGGVPEFAKHGENALLVAPEDAHALADAIAELRGDDELRERVAHGGRRTASELSWVNIARKYEELYATAVSKRD
jgi:glycosyltransferase involved in cell wall biosynthesis